MGSEWAAAPVAILREAFELQQNPLDNCAAACTCSAWRSVVSSSSIQNVHLHIHKTQPATWTAFLQSRPCIDKLKLTCSAPSDTDADATANGAQLLTPALRCKHLILSQHAAKRLSADLHNATELQKLSLQWPFQGGVHNSDFSPVPSLQGMTNLKDLDVHGHSGARPDILMHECIPGSLMSLTLTQISQADDRTSASPYMLPKALLQSQQPPYILRHLALTYCRFSLHNSSISCLSNLDSLSLEGSTVYADQQLGISQLTKLTMLDLRYTRVFSCKGHHATRALGKFEAWSSLKVLKLTHTTVVSHHTAMQVVHLDELHLDLPLICEMSVSKTLPVQAAIHATVMAPAGKMKSWISLDGKPVVEMHAFVDLLDCCSCDFLPFVQACTSMRTFRLWDMHKSGIEVAIGPWLGELKYLQNLQLVRVRCADFCLEYMTTLTSLTLRYVEYDSVFKTVGLPMGLHELDFAGACLFHNDVQHNLQQLTELTRLDLTYSAANCSPSLRKAHVTLPAMPMSIRRLVLCAWQTDRLCSPNWSVLETCKHLEHLTVPDDQLESDDLQVFVAGTKLLHIVDNYKDYRDVKWL